jgi:hypothetical protein
LTSLPHILSVPTAAGDGASTAWQRDEPEPVPAEEAFGKLTIKGQDRGGLSALTGRRKTVLDGLAACPAAGPFVRVVRERR